MRYSHQGAQVLINQNPTDIFADGLRLDIIVIKDNKVTMVDVVITSQH
jgi:hypothetical protein